MKDRNRSHFIQRFKFDFEIENQDDANRLHNDLSRLFKDRLKAILERLLNENDDPNYVTRIPLLEIDLGDIQASAMDFEVVQRFEQRFRRELQMRMAEISHPTAVRSAERGERIMMAPAKMEVLIFFLTQGRLPIGAEDMAGSVEELFWDLLENQPADTLQMIKSIGKASPPALKRMASAFSDKLVERVYKLVANQNSISISSYEKKVAAGIAKATGKSERMIHAELRLVLMRFLFVDMASSFRMKQMEEVVAEKMVAKFGKETADVFKGASKVKSNAAEPSEIEEAKYKEAARDIIANVIKGRTAVTSNIGIIEAWEYLVANDIPSLKQLLAQQANSPAALATLVEAIPTQALRNFIQRVSKTIGLRLLQLAATVISAHDLFNPSTPAQVAVTHAVYAALLHVLANDPTATPAPRKTLEAIQTHLESISSKPKELLEAWKQFDFIGTTTTDQPKKKADITPQTEAERAEAEELTEAELQALAEEERSKPPMTPAERRIAAQKAQEEYVAAERKRQEQAEIAKKEAAAKREAAEAAGEPVEVEPFFEDDETFFKRGRELERPAAPGEGPDLETIENLAALDAGEQLFAAPNLATAAARADLVMHYLAVGAAPWWAKRFIPLQVEIMLKGLIQREPAAVQEAFVRIAKSLPPARYPQFVERIATLVEEKTFVNLLPVLAGDLGGFTVTIGLALQEAIATLPAGMQAPSTAKEIRQFGYQYQLRYLMEYASSGPTAGQMLRFVLKQLQPLTGLSSRRLIEWMSTVIETLIAKGENRFLPLKSMLPKTFEGIEVAAPVAHPRTVDVVAFQQALAEVKSASEAGAELAQQKLEAEQEAQARLEAKKQADSPETAEQKAKDQAALDPDAPRTQDQARPETPGIEGPLGPKDAQVDQDLQHPAIDADGNPIFAPDSPEGKAVAEKVAAEKKAAEKKAAEEQAAEEEAAEEKAAEKKAATEQTAEEKAAEEKAAEERAKTRSKFREKLERQFAPKTPETPPVENKTWALSPAEAEALGVGGDWVIGVIKQYLIHGTLSPAATALYTVDSFKAELQVVLASGTKPVIQMMREIIGDRNVRARLFALGEETVLRALALLNVGASDRLVPFVKEMLAIFKGTSSPIAPAYVFEHAMRHARSLRTTFLPINYVKEFFEFIATQPNVRVKEAIIWANRRLESSNSPLRNSLVEMIDVVERIEELRETRQQNPKTSDQRPKAPPRVPKPFDEEIYVSNGGVGIIYLFTVMLFKAFNLITEDKKAFVSRQAQVRAIHQIQYLCYKEVDTPEEKMVMAKLMVGWSLDEPVDPLETPMAQDDIDTCETILGMVNTQWGVMKNASTDYLRKTFIMRDGRLKQGASDWVLRVEQNGIDVLRNKIPWSTNPIRLPWLSYIIEVEWP